MLKAWKKLNLAQQILIFMVIGVIAGVALGEKAAVLKPIGDMFIKAVQMMVIILIAPAMISGFCSVDNPKDLGRTGLKIIGFFVVLTILAGSLSLVLVNVLKPGEGVR